MAYYRCGGGGLPEIRKVNILTESEYSLLNPSSDEIYSVSLDSNIWFNIKNYQGNKRLLNHLPVGTDLSEWEFWFEDLRYGRPINPLQYFTTQLQLFLSANAGRDFELRFNATPDTSSQNFYLITDTSEDYSIRINDRDYPNKIIVHKYLNSSGSGNVMYTYNYGDDVIIKRENGIITININGTIVDTYTAYTATNGNYTNIGGYSTYYDGGYIKFIGFRWLS